MTELESVLLSWVTGECPVEAVSDWLRENWQGRRVILLPTSIATIADSIVYANDGSLVTEGGYGLLPVCRRLRAACGDDGAAIRFSTVQDGKGLTLARLWWASGPKGLAIDPVQYVK